MKTVSFTVILTCIFLTTTQIMGQELAINIQCKISKNTKRVKHHSTKPFLSRKKRVTGGQFVEDSDLPPWAVAIITQDDHEKISWCLGTLLDNGWVLTAAHCFQNKDTSKTIIAVDDKADGYPYNAQKIEIHPSFKSNKFSYEYDAALVKLKVNGTESKTILNQLKTACFSPSLDIDNIEAKSFGMGSTSDENITKLNKKVDLLIYPNGECLYSKAPHLKFNQEQMVCAGPQDKTNSEDSLCDEDIGTGLIVTDDNDNVAVVGIASWNLVCAGPTVFQRVAPIYDWIYETINQ